MKTTRQILTAVFWLAGACGPAFAPPDDFGMCAGQPATVVREAITTNTTWTANQRYLLSGRIDVKNGATLQIEPGTVICGDADQQMMNVSYLNVDLDAKLIADGQAERPIVFTSSRPIGQRKPQDWGGVVLRGRGPVNNPPDTGKGPETTCVQAEASAGQYGPCGILKPDDNSGVLRSASNLPGASLPPTRNSTA